jgi:two-component system cell cycle sensor histidine kinase/response regulator CckA
VPVLVVDDNQDVAEATARLLEAMGCPAYTADTRAGGFRALQHAANAGAPIRLAVIDWNLGHGVTGVQALGALQIADRHLKAILMTGYAAEGQAQRFLEQGCQAFLPKPFTLNELRRVLMDLASGHDWLPAPSPSPPPAEGKAPGPP